LAIGFFFRNKLEQGHSRASIKLKDGTSRDFLRYYVKRTKTMGPSDFSESEDGPVDLSTITKHLTVKGDAVQIVSEFDGNDPKNFLTMIKTQNYRRRLDKEKIEKWIIELNKKFSIDESQPFYRGYILPSEEDINNYRKVYSNTRIFINSNALVEKVKNNTTEEIKIMVLDCFKKAIIDKHLGNNPFRKTRSRFRAHRLARSFKQLKKSIESNNKESLIKGVTNFLANTYAEEFGVDFLKSYLGVDNIYVMGNISGIYPSFSDLEDFFPNANRRFAGKSWGTYSVVPPIQKFLINENLLIPSTFIESSIPMYDIFGGLPSGLGLID
jgi:hypothetical protein